MTDCDDDNDDDDDVNHNCVIMKHSIAACSAAEVESLHGGEGDVAPPSLPHTNLPDVTDCDVDDDDYDDVVVAEKEHPCSARAMQNAI